MAACRLVKVSLCDGILTSKDYLVGLHRADRVGPNPPIHARAFCQRYRFNQRRAKPSNPCGMKITMAMKMMPTVMR